MKWYKKALLFLLFLLTLLIGLGVFITYKYSDEIKQYGVQQVNKLIQTEITVEEIEFSVFEKFPDASLAFKNVEAKEVVDHREKGTLLRAKSIYLQFNILKLMRGTYQLNSISFEDGAINMHIDENGNANYHFWKQENKGSDEFVLKLEAVKLKNIELTFENEIKKTYLRQTLKNTAITGQFSTKEYELKINGLLYVSKYQKGKATLMKNRNVFLDVELEAYQEKQHYVIRKGAISIEEMHFFLLGDITLGEEANLVNFTFKGNKLAIPSLISLFPDEYKSKLNDYKSEGEIKLDGLMRGWLSATKSPEVNIAFNIRQGNMRHRPSGIVLKNIALKGNVSNGSNKNLRSTSLTIDSIYAHFGAGTVSGKYNITNFENPLLDLTAKIKGVALEEIHTFFPFDSIQTLSGMLDMDFKLRGAIQDLRKMTVEDFRKAKTFGKARIREGKLAFKKSRYLIRELNAELAFNNNDVKVDHFSGRVFENDFEINGLFKNLLPYLLLKNEPLFLKARLHAGQLNWDDFMPEITTSGETSFAFPERLTFDLWASVDAFRFRRFKAMNFNGQLNYNNRKFSVSEATLQSMKGMVTGGILIDASNPSKVKFTANGQLEKVQIEEVFSSFDNFGQQLLTNQHLKGVCSADIRFSSLWSEKWKPDLSSIQAGVDISIEQGELINFKPVYALSNFIRVEELNHIRFSSLKNEIEIKDRKILIPEMEIKSSALNLNLSGIHGFNNVIDYHFNLLLRDVLSKKARKAKKENDEFGGHVKDDGLGRTTLFLKMTGSVDDPKISYDRKGLREKWRKDLQAEKETIKSILKDEFSRQSAEKKRDLSGQEEYEFQMEWEEEESASDTPVKKEPSSEIRQRLDTTKKKKGRNKWLNKVTKPQKQEYEEYDAEELD